MFTWLYKRVARYYILTASFFTGNNYFHKTIYQGKLKGFYFPGLNCYACPLARFSCPLGSFQNFIGARTFPVYVLGFMGLIGIMLGRLVCGWICPFGFFQEILYRIKTFKIRVSQRYSYSKYVILFILAIALPLLTSEPWFCKLCPAGGIEAGIPMVLLDPFLRVLIGLLFYIKMIIVAALVSFSILVKRPFCRFVCPLGAIYGIFNKFTFFKIQVDENKCIECYACQNVCPMDVQIFKTPESVDCIRCGECIKECPTSALSFKYGIYSAFESSSEKIVKKSTP
jgi:ferredoxin-type protein NapH